MSAQHLRIYALRPPGRLTSDFGPRISRRTGRTSHHNGVDFAQELGALVPAVVPGEVVHSGFSSRRPNGLHVKTQTERVRAFYLHLCQSTAPMGLKLQPGDPVGTEGNTGKVSLGRGDCGKPRGAGYHPSPCNPDHPWGPVGHHTHYEFHARGVGATHRILRPIWLTQANDQRLGSITGPEELLVAAGLAGAAGVLIAAAV